MPCTKCANGKWRWGSGPCQYDTKADCERANGGSSMTENQIQFARADMAVEVLTAEEDGDKGIVEAIVSAYNVKYRMGFFTHHTIEPGAFADSIAAEPTIPLFWMHAWDWTEQPPIGHAEASEVNKPKPGLKVSGEMYLDQPGVTPVFRNLKAGALKQWSIAYRILASRVDEDDEDNTIITEAELLEASSVLRGANPGTETLKVASLHPATMRRVAEALGVDPERLTRLVAGDPAEGLPPVDSVSDTPTSTSTDDDEKDAAEADEEPEEPQFDDLGDAAREIQAMRLGKRLEAVQ